MSSEENAPVVNVENEEADGESHHCETIDLVGCPHRALPAQPGALALNSDVLQEYNHVHYYQSMAFANRTTKVKLVTTWQST